MASSLPISLAQAEWPAISALRYRRLGLIVVVAGDYCRRRADRLAPFQSAPDYRQRGAQACSIRGSRRHGAYFHHERSSPAGKNLSSPAHAASVRRRQAALRRVTLGGAEGGGEEAGWHDGLAGGFSVLPDTDDAA